MSFKSGVFGDYFNLEKGISYKGDELVDESDVALVTLDTFLAGGGYKKSSEKPYAGTYKDAFVLAPGDVVIATTDVTQDGAVLAAPALIPQYEENFSDLVWSLDVAKLVPKTGDVLVEFVYNFLRVPLNRRRAAYGDTGTTVRRVPFEAMYEQVIPVPSLEEQGRISSFIAALDRKIQLNTATAETLEKIAQSVFRSWFIDFDPVKAKMAGEKPLGMNEATAALFPDSMVVSELGTIPKGWSKGWLKDLALISYGAPFSSKFFNSAGDGMPLIRIRDLKTQSIATWTTEVHTKGFMTKTGTLLIGMDGEFNPTLWFGPDSWVNQRICRIEGKSEMNSMYLYFTLLPIMKRIEHGSTGSTVIHLGKTDLDAIGFLNPPQEVLARYRELTEPILHLLGNMAATNRVLVGLRDSLLPRLISGELQIPEELLL
jgi:type I restriction enzyme S subunit